MANEEQIADKPTVSVTVQQGQTQGKIYPLESGTRLSNLLTQISLSKNDYWYATAWLRKNNKLNYQQKKAELSALISEQIKLKNKHQQQWQQVLENVSAIKPSDRLVTPIHPDRVFADKQSNFLLQNGDTLLIPSRPNFVAIAGFTEQTQQPHKAIQDLLTYLETSSALPLADNSYVWLINPDTSIEKLPIAYWNKRDPRFIAPGSTLYVPAKEQTFSNDYQAINQLYLELLQNQIIGSSQGE
ncbi:capsule biosynthesis GfcC family protein [Agarivorans albus]